MRGRGKKPPHPDPLPAGEREERGYSGARELFLLFLPL